MRKQIKHIIMVAGGVIFVFAGCFWWYYGYGIDKQETDMFSRAYYAYVDLADRREGAAYKPGEADNETRRSLNSSLSEVLIGDIEDSERLSLSKDILRYAKDLEGQVLEINRLGEWEYGAIEDMENGAYNILNRRIRGAVNNIVLLAKHRHDTANDIAVLALAINGHIRDIAMQIINDEGRLTEGHIASLNNDVGFAEKQYEELQSLYGKLHNLKNEITDAYAEFTKIIN